MSAGLLTVYLVEDSPIIVTLLTRLLRDEAGVNVVGSCGDAAQAIEELTKLRPDVAVVDVLLASGTGYEVLKALHQALPATQAIVLTSFTSDEHRQAARRLGVADGHFLDKNTQIPRLLTVVQGMAAARRR